MSDIYDISYLKILEKYEQEYKDISKKIDKNTLEIDCINAEKDGYLKKLLIIRILLIIASVVVAVGAFIGLYFFIITSNLSPDDRALLESNTFEFIIKHEGIYILPTIILVGGIIATLSVTLKKRRNKIDESKKELVPFLKKVDSLQPKMDKYLNELESFNSFSSASLNYSNSLSSIPNYESNEFHLNSYKCYYDDKNYIEYESCERLNNEKYNLTTLENKTVKFDL